MIVYQSSQNLDKKSPHGCNISSIFSLDIIGKKIPRYFFTYSKQKITFHLIVMSEKIESMSENLITGSIERMQHFVTRRNF